ncbi:MAG TPA: peptidoglycan editing factor PgeF [Firmicutes bacterium]|nr:peptidoglycan editing factor PgeF [Bacillota bacterium]
MIKANTWSCVTGAGLKKYQALSLNNGAVIQAVSSRDYGNMALHTGDQPEQVIFNRKLFLDSLYLNLENLVTAEQIHSTNIQIVDKSHLGAGALSLQTALSKTDALITAERGVVLGILTADCLPIFIYDPMTPAIAIIHAGWRGTIAEISRLTMDRMIHDFKTDPGNCQVAIGPSICSACFEVSSEVADLFGKVNSETVIPTESGFEVDLSGFNSYLLQHAGVKPEHIDIANLCTGCHNEDFFSYRIEKGTKGRMMGIISLQ